MPEVQHRIDRDLEALKPMIEADSKDLQLRVTPEEVHSADQLLDQLGVQRSQSIVILQPGARYWFKAGLRSGMRSWPIVSPPSMIARC